MAGTIRAVAEAAGVSKTTVSFVMNNTRPQVDRIPEETRERIRACAVALGYTHNPIAASIRTGKRVWIGVMTEVLPAAREYWQWAPFFEVSLLYGVQRRLADHGYFTLLALRKPEYEAQDIDQLASAQVGGLIFRAADAEAVRKAEDLLASGIPVVNVFPRQASDLFPFTVDLDNIHAGRLAAEIAVRCGARNPAYIVPQAHGKHLDDRASGFVQGIRDGLGTAPGLCELPQRPEGTVNSGLAIATLKTFIEKNRPDALIAMDGGTSSVVNSALEFLHVRVPGDLSFIGFDAFLLGNSSNRSVSSVGVSWLRAGEEAADIVVEQVENGANTGGVSTDASLPRLLTPVFVQGDTTTAEISHELAVGNLDQFLSPSR